MGKQKETDGQYVKKETMLVVALVAVIVGFLGGVVFSAYKSGVGLDGSAPGPSGQTAQKQDISNNLAQEINDLEKEISLHPENIEALIRLGNLYFDTEQPGKAIMAYNNALELNPGNPDVLTDLGVMYRRKGQPLEAIKVFDKAIKIDPRHEASRFNKGVVLLHDLNDSEGAIRAWEELVEVNPFARANGDELVLKLIEKIKGRDNPAN
ncbi:MAG: tetratricopeptide repeat protein [Deltaproteobacteria bacterium]|uniref:Tetratricopeptide repeat protein n=1 Tax=Candidatus Desulfacyla euxinica TaxID=2841693 RepID=A0A8J6T3K4_9DELT|nr:tetratricopeptide repeat protein [Candidatus Desulfacyla euxinica]